MQTNYDMTKGLHHERVGVGSVQEIGRVSASERSVSIVRTRHQPAEVEFSSSGKRGTENKTVGANRNRLAKDSGWRSITGWECTGQ